MRRVIHYFLAILLTVPAMALAQQAQSRYTATPEQLQARETYAKRFDQVVNSYYESNPLAARPVVTTPRPVPSGKVSALSPIPLGTSSNALTALRGEQNQVAVDNATDAVAFIHRQDITIWGGASTENGKFRYDISIDNGATFSNDIGPLQSTYTNYGRYPNCAFFNENGTANPLAEKLVYQGPTNRFPTPGWIGQVNGLSDVTTTGTPTTITEHYQFDGQNVLLPGGLCEGMDGEFWSVDFSFDGTNVMDSIRLNKGVYNSGTGDITWSLDRLIDPGYDKSFDGSIGTVGPNIDFSPDGMTGWIGIVANVTAGTNTNNETLMPVFIKTTDGGATWGNPIEVDLDAITWIADSLQSLWIDTTGNPASDGRAIATFDYDIVTDMNGNVHMGVVIGTAGGGFAVSSGLAKFMADVYTTDGGATWDVAYLGPVLTFRGTYGSGSAPITIDNFCQVARNEVGDKIVFTWVDSDTSIIFGSQNGIGFGQSTNDAPNLRMVARDIVTGTQTYPKLVTDGDLLWDGRALNPAMAQIVVENSGMLEMPIVAMEFLQGDPNLPTQFHYFGNDVTLDLSDPTIWCVPSMMDLGWLSISTPGSTPVCIVNTDDPSQPNVVLYDWYPNPSTSEARIQFELPAVTEVHMWVTNAMGQHITTLVDGELNTGKHVASLDATDLAAGVYFCHLSANGKNYNKKLVVSH